MNQNLSASVHINPPNSKFDFENKSKSQMPPQLPNPIFNNFMPFQNLQSLNINNNDGIAPQPLGILFLMPFTNKNNEVPNFSFPNNFTATFTAQSNKENVNNVESLNKMQVPEVLKPEINKAPEPTNKAHNDEADLQSAPLSQVRTPLSSIADDFLPVTKTNSFYLKRIKNIMENVQRATNNFNNYTYVESKPLHYQKPRSDSLSLNETLQYLKENRKPVISFEYALKKVK